LIGEGQLEGEYRQLVADLGLTERVTFRGAVPNDEVLRSMAASAVTVVPSRSEAFGLVNIESFAVKTPVIASAVGGIPEIIRDGVDGFLVPPDDPKALAEKLRRLLSDRALCEQMGENARQRFLEKFEQTNNVEQQVRWFEELTRQHRREASSG
jgi:glycosyltransferase involved in cell wall biosynthesis